MFKRIWGIVLVMCMALTLVLGSMGSALARETEWIDVTWDVGRYRGYGFKRDGNHFREGFGIFEYTHPSGRERYQGIYVGYYGINKKMNLRETGLGCMLVVLAATRNFSYR